MARLGSADRTGEAVAEALPAAAEAMQIAEQWLSCRDQNQDLTAAVDPVLGTLRGEVSRELSAQAAHLRSRAQMALMEVGIKATMSIITGRFPTSRTATPPTPPFGLVLIAVGSVGVPDGLRAINISALARSEGIPASVVEKRIAAQGNVLLTPEAFEQLVDWLRAEVLSGRVDLPYHPPAGGQGSHPVAINLRCELRIVPKQ